MIDPKLFRQALGAFATGVTGGVPLFDDCAARFACRATFEHEGGDHAIFVGEVIDLALAPAAPLIFHGGRYSQVMPQGQRPSRPDDAAEGEFGRYFTGHLLGRAYNVAFEEIRREYRQRGLHSSDYTVLASLGLGEGISPSELLERASRGEVALPHDAIDRLIERGDVARTDATLHLTSSGRSLLNELIAVAEATQMQLEWSDSDIRYLLMQGRTRMSESFRTTRNH